MLEYATVSDTPGLKEKAELLRLMGHPTRLAIIRQLARGPRCVTDIQELLDVPQANVSQHLASLRSMRVVNYHEDGNLRCYYIARPKIASLVLQFLGEDYHIVEKSKEEVRQAAKRYRAAEACSVPDAASRHENGVPNDPKSHWEQVYEAKGEAEVSWHQDEPALSLDLIRQAATPESRVIDVGGGSSVLAGRLVSLGFKHVAVLDIAEAALDRSKARIGPLGQRVHWIAADVTATKDLGPFDVWHDRAVFHFLTKPDERRKYVEVAAKTVPIGGHLIVGTFALAGPEKCSGLTVERYDGQKLAGEFGQGFALRREMQETHVTPWGKPQKFTFAVFERIKQKSHS